MAFWLFDLFSALLCLGSGLDSRLVLLVLVAMLLLNYAYAKWSSPILVCCFFRLVWIVIVVFAHCLAQVDNIYGKGMLPKCPSKAMAKHRLFA